MTRRAAAPWARRVAGPAARWFLAALALLAAGTLQGCLPPDWSFCDCDFRDNFWNSVLTDVSLLFDEPNLAQKARDNTTWHGRYLQGPMPDGYDCPTEVTVFWKGWPRFGMTRGLIEGSMGDLWMPAARDRFKQICIAGHLALCTLCSQHFLVRAARAQEAGDPQHMRWLEAAYGHMVAIRNLAKASQLRFCMGQQGWPMKVGALHAYAERWLGREADGTSPMAAYMGDRIDHYQMMFAQEMAHTDETRAAALPDRRPCVPLKNPKCWRRMSKLLIETCEFCCSPFQHASGRGHPACFDAEWTYERCCQTDFQDLVCELKRKGEEGGCVDCKKTVSYVCLTPPEKRLQDAEENYNKKVDHYNDLLKKKDENAADTQRTQEDLVVKDAYYRSNHSDLNEKIRIWSAAFNNASRLMSHSRLTQQQRTHNASLQASKAAQLALRDAQEALRNASGTLRDAEAQNRSAHEALARNESASARAAAAAAEALSRLDAARGTLRAAEVAAGDADAEAAAAASAEVEAASAALSANMSRDAAHAATGARLDAALAAQRLEEVAEHEAATVDSAAADRARGCQDRLAAAGDAWKAAAAAEAAAERREAAAAGAEEAALAAATKAGALRQDREREAQEVAANASLVAGALRRRLGSAEVADCLGARTPANASARPRTPEDAGASAPCAAGPPPEDGNEFCVSWAAEGQCEANLEYMRDNCAKSCRKGPALPPCPSGAAAEPLLAAGQLASMVAQLRAVTAALPPAADKEFGTSRDAGEGDGGALAAARAGAAGAARALAAAREHEASAQAASARADAAASRAASALSLAEEAKQVAQLAREAAALRASAAEREAELWRGAVAANVTAVGARQSDLQAAADSRDGLQRAAEGAGELQRRAEEARGAADEAAASARRELEAAAAQISVVRGEIETLNASLPENLTLSLATWLDGIEVDDGGNGGEWMQLASTVLGYAKRVLLPLVRSVEAFFDRYEVGGRNRDDARKLLDKLQEEKAMVNLRRSAQGALEAAQAEAAGAAERCQAAVASSEEAQAAAVRARAAVAEAEDALRSAEELLLLARDGLNASEGSLAACRGELAAREGELQRAAESAAAAASAAAEAEVHAERSREAIASAQAAVVEAGAGAEAASAVFAAEEAGAAEGRLAALRKECKADAEQFGAYLREADLLGLLVAAGARTEQARAASVSQHSETLAARASAQRALEAARKNCSDARALTARREEEARKLGEECDALGAARNETQAAHAVALQALRAAQAVTEGVVRERAPADAAAAAAAAAHGRAAAALNASLEGARLRYAEVAAAMNATEACLRSRDDAELQDVHAAAALDAATAWLAAFVPTLELGVKASRLRGAEEDEAAKRSAEARAARRERRMALLLETHRAHLALLDAQTELAEKDAAMGAAKAAFDKAEKDVVDAQEKLDKLVTAAAEYSDDIAKTHKEIGEGLEEYHSAKAGYDAQDPEERRRSFSTKLEGSGADPGPDHK